jgi:putative phosphonate metabolism protein
MQVARYALYYVPPENAAWTRFATSWLGRDMQAGKQVAYPALPDLPLPLADITGDAQKYGLHATIKPPFRLASGAGREALEDACAALCRTQALFSIGPLRLTSLGRFLALCVPDSKALSDFTAKCVRDLDSFRAPVTPDELARRRTKGLSPRQDTNLTAWGYPYVLDDFRFHITLTSRLPKPVLPKVKTVLDTALMPLVPPVVAFGDLALAGEDGDGRFHLLRRFRFEG